ncbi:MAG: hypothetical protein QOH06_895 [Acidobacteriota bacterium]|jgi:hypothetical protein|nr:hypothetical protein [Acidobacteriota bacterium]
MRPVWIILLLLCGACAKEPATPIESEPRAVPPALPVPVEIPSEPGEAGIRDFVTMFMDVRLTGDDVRARDYLSPTALEQYAAPKDILPLTSMSFTGWDLLALNAADANSWEARVRIRREDDQIEEVLFVGPGADASGAQRPWIIRGAARP